MLGWNRVPKTEARSLSVISKSFLRSIAQDIGQEVKQEPLPATLDVYREGLQNMAQGQGDFLQF